MEGVQGTAQICRAIGVLQSLGYCSHWRAMSRKAEWMLEAKGMPEKKVVPVHMATRPRPIQPLARVMDQDKNRTFPKRVDNEAFYYQTRIEASLCRSLRCFVVVAREPRRKVLKLSSNLGMLPLQAEYSTVKRTTWAGCDLTLQCTFDWPTWSATTILPSPSATK